MAIYGQAHYDSGARYSADPPPVTSKKKSMKKVKLNLRERDDNNVSALAKAHGVKVDGTPATYTNMEPVKAAYDLLVADFDAKLAAEVAATTALAQAVAERKQSRADLEVALNARAGRVDAIAKGDVAIIAGAGFEASDDPTPTSALETPGNVRVEMTTKTGENRVRWKPVEGAVTYVIECRDHGDTPGPWVQVKFSSASRVTVTGLVPGKTYAFRVKAIGPNGLESGWSDEAIGMGSP